MQSNLASIFGLSIGAMTDEAGNTEPEEFESGLVVSEWEDQEPSFLAVMRERSCTFFLPLSQH